MKAKTRTMLEFEQSFGQPKLKQLQRDLAVEREKVDITVYAKTPNCSACWRMDS